MILWEYDLDLLVPIELECLNKDNSTITTTATATTP